MAAMTTLISSVSAVPPLRSLVIRECDFSKWLDHARPGDRLEYHRGHLVIDRAYGVSRLDEKHRGELHAIAKRAVFLAEASRLILVQLRLDEGEFSYVAIKTKQQAWRAA